MKKETLAVWQEGEYSYPLAFGFVPNLVSYIHEEDTQERPCMLVVPGGGYCVVSPTEGEIVAMEFYEKGYNAFVFTYTTNPLMLEPLKDQSMRDLSRAIRLIRSRAGEFHIDPCRLILCGFSAGGHLCASVCVHYMDVEDGRYGSFSNRPDAAILSYPVITSADKAHRGSFRHCWAWMPQRRNWNICLWKNRFLRRRRPVFYGRRQRTKRFRWKTATCSQRL